MNADFPHLRTASACEVVMTLCTSVADDHLGQYYRRTAAIADRLGKSLDFDSVMKALQRIHDGELDPLVLHAGEFAPFLEIEVGGKSKDELLAEIEANGMFASDYAKDIMSKPAWKLGEHEKVKFAKVKVRDLGFTKNPTTKEIWNRIEELGHSLCEPGDGPSLRKEWKDQPRGTTCWTAMKQIADFGGDSHVFALDRDVDGESWLRTSWTGPDARWDLGGGIVFRLRKQALVPGTSA